MVANNCQEGLQPTVSIQMSTDKLHRVVAAVAHFDPDNTFDESFEVLLDCLLQVCNQVLVVSTSAPAVLPNRFSGRVECIFRPNIGYDFYSYKVGVLRLASSSPSSSLFLVNSSFLITDRARFISCLQRMVANGERLDVVSVTQSEQIRPHLQSYLLYINRTAMHSAWFADWVDGIQPQNNKMELILRGEIDLSLKANNAGARIGAVFTYSRTERWHGALRWVKFMVDERKTAPLLNPRAWFRFNPVHFLASTIASRCGLVKAELVRSNPCRQDLAWLDDPVVFPEYRQIRAFADRSKRHYQGDASGLTVLARGHMEPLPNCRLVLSAPLARNGVRTAVVLHLFYPELIREVRTYLRNIVEPFDLFVTTPHEGAVHLILDGFADTAASICVALAENRGRDIGPFLALLKTDILQPYEAVLKIHGKRSLYSDAGDQWRRRLFAELVGCARNTRDAIRLLRDPTIGIVGPHKDYLTNPQYWGANRETVSRLLKPILPEGVSTIQLGFFAGSMFWFKPHAIRQCADLVESAALEFGLENGKQDGTLAHAVERIFGNVAQLNGFHATSLKLNGASISVIDASDHFTPVIRHKRPS